MTFIEFPIQIGLEGAPGSGKTQLVEEFVKLSGDWFRANGSDIAVIENGGTLLERDFDQAMGVVGSWSDDLYANFLRYQQEMKVRSEGVSFITKGTTIGHIAHCGINLENILTGFQMPDHQVRIQRQQVGMTALTFLFQEQFRYLFGFYLPPSGTQIIMPGKDDAEETYNRRIDSALRVVFGNFGLRIQVLDQPTIEEKAQAMFDTVKRIVEEGPQQEEEEPAAEEVPPTAEAILAE